MKNLKKMNRLELKSINGGAACNASCPPGPEFPSSYEAFHALPECCKSKVLVYSDCFPR